MNILAILFFGALGGVFRYSIGFVIHTQGFPAGTLFVNLLGSFLLGSFYTLIKERPLPTFFRVGISVGFIGSFTTFSSFTEDTVHLMQNQPLAGILYVLASLMGGLVMVLMSEMMVTKIFHHKERHRAASHVTSDAKEIFE